MPVSDSGSSLTQLADVFEQMGRLQKKAARLLREVELGPDFELEKPEPKIPAHIDECWEKYLQGWAAFMLDRNGKKPNMGLAPKLTAKRVKLIKDACVRQGPDRVKRALIGLFLSDWHTGVNPNNKTYLEPERALVIKQDRDMVEYFAQAYSEAHDEY